MAAEGQLSPENKKILMVRGCPFSSPFSKFYISSVKNIEETMDYMPRDGDVVFVSYPKTGSTWMQYIVLQIVSKAGAFCSLYDMGSRVSPSLPNHSVAAVDALSGFRSYKCHIPFNLVRKNERAKYIYTYRHPDDTLVSYFHALKNLYQTCQFEEFVDCFVGGTLLFGSYFEHVRTFYEHRHDPNVLMLSYEKMHADRRDVTLRVAEFLGEEHRAFLVENEDVVDEILQNTSFENMKKKLTDMDPPENALKKAENFFRKGTVGDGKNLLSMGQRERVKEAAGILRGTTIYEEWYP